MTHFFQQALVDFFALGFAQIAILIFVKLIPDLVDHRNDVFVLIFVQFAFFRFSSLRLLFLLRSSGCSRLCLFLLGFLLGCRRLGLFLGLLFLRLFFLGLLLLWFLFLGLFFNRLWLLGLLFLGLFFFDWLRLGSGCGLSLRCR